LFAGNHLAIHDAMFERLHRHFDDGEIVELTTAIARHLAFGRMTKVLGIDQACPLPAAPVVESPSDGRRGAPLG
jgi:hypothetical protein